MNTTLTVWSIFAGDGPDRCWYTKELQDWCYLKSHIDFQVFSCREVLARKATNREYPDLILLNSNRRGEFSREMLQRVVGKYPLSLLLEITGEWCIGDTRSGDPLPIACRFDAMIARQRLQLMLTSRQHFLQMRSDLNPLGSFSELTAFWNRNNPASRSTGINLIASDCCDRQALRMLLSHEGINAHLYANRQGIVEGNRYRPVVYCINDRRELETLSGETISSPTVIITNHLNDLDKTFFAGGFLVTFLRKPFLAHDVVNAINNVCLLSNANAA
jgi:hypothetical protein